jgi:glyoxylase-like metal-dependent hydrolase (beta-lactamase superfamily II)
MELHAFYDPATFTLTYVVFDPRSKDAVIVDPVLDFDPVAAQTDTRSAKEVVAFVREHGLHARYVLETHAHADHLSASQFLKRELGAAVAIGQGITEVQQTFKAVFDLGADFRTDGGQFDRLLLDREVLEAGTLRVEVIATPGHTPACLTFRIGDAVFTGDALFMEDYGTGRCDFPRGSAEALYDSVHERLYTLPEETRVFVGHDYQPGGRELRYQTTIGASKRSNVQLRAETPKDTYVKFRHERDATLAPPRLLFQSVQVNINAGHLPPAHASGGRYIVTPLNLFRPADAVGAPLVSAGETK